MKARAAVVLVVLLVAAAGATSALAGAAQVQDGTNETGENATTAPADGSEEAGGDDRISETGEPEPGPETAGTARNATDNGTQAGNETGNETNVTVRVTMDDQLSDGRTVVVESVALPEGGFVTVHDERLREGDAVGSAVGVSEYLEPGEHTSVEITLFNVSGAEFGDVANGTADATVDEAGNESTFGDGQTGANESTPGDSQADNETTVGDNLTADNETEVLNDGTRLTENQTLVAMPHRDTNGDREYDFVTSNGTEDGPYIENGTAVTDDADVDVVNESDVPMALPFEIERDGNRTVNETVEPFLEPPENGTNQTTAGPGNETALGGDGFGVGAGPGDSDASTNGGIDDGGDQGINASGAQSPGGGATTGDGSTGANAPGGDTGATTGDDTSGPTGATAGGR